MRFPTALEHFRTGNDRRHEKHAKKLFFNYSLTYYYLSNILWHLKYYISSNKFPCFLVFSSSVVLSNVIIYSLSELYLKTLKEGTLKLSISFNVPISKYPGFISILLLFIRLLLFLQILYCNHSLTYISL